MWNWKSPITALVVAGSIFLATAGFLWVQNDTPMRASVGLDSIVPMGLYGNRERSQPNQAVLTTEMSTSTELDAIEADLQNTTILDEDFSNL